MHDAIMAMMNNIDKTPRDLPPTDEQKAMHEAIMAMLNNVPDTASRGVQGLNVGEVENSASFIDQLQQDAVMLALTGIEKVVPLLDEARKGVDEANALITVVSTIIETAARFEQSQVQDTTEQGSEEKPKFRRKREVKGPAQDGPRHRPTLYRSTCFWALERELRLIN